MHVNFFTSFPKIFRRNPTEVEYKTIKTFDMDSSKLLIKKLKTLLDKPRDLSVLQIPFSLTIFTLISFLKYFC